MLGYAQDIAGPTAEQLAEIVRLARLQFQLEREIADDEAAITAKRDALRRVMETDLPEAMQAAGVTEQPLGGGFAVKLQTDILSASLKKAPENEDERAKQQAMLDWLDKSGNHSLVKRSLMMFFSRDQMRLYRKFLRDLSQRKTPIEHAARFWVEPQTLAAFVREQTKTNPDFPKELFGVFERTYTKLVAPKKSKAL